MGLNDSKLYLKEGADRLTEADGERYKVLVSIAEEKLKKLSKREDRQ